MNTVLRNSIKLIYHIKRCIIKNKNENHNNFTNNENLNIITTNKENNIITNDNENNDENYIENHNENKNRTVIVGPSFCGKTHLLINKKQLNRLDNSEKKYVSLRGVLNKTANLPSGLNTEIEGDVVEEDLEDRTIQDFQNCCDVFDDMLDSNQKLTDPFFTRGRHNDLDVYYLSQSFFDLPKHTIRNNNNIITLFQQTLKDVIHIYRDIAGFDMSYDEVKSLCREA